MNRDRQYDGWTLPELLAGLADGELEAADRARVESWLASHLEAGADLDVQRRLGYRHNRLWLNSAAPLPPEASWFQMAVRVRENTLRQEWRGLTAVLGKPDLPLQVVAGNLEADLPQLNEEQVVETIAKDSPAVRIASISTARAQAVLTRAKAEPVPDLQVRAGAVHSGEEIGGLNRPTGWEGIAEVGVTLPIWNRNQGNIAAARQDIDRAQREEKRVELTLRERAAAMLDQYATARIMADEYRDGLLPRATKAYSLLVDKYGKMLASYPVVLDSQKTLYQLHLEYVATLENVWTTGIALQGYLLTDGLEAPARPSEVDRPVRETNVPMSRSMSNQQ